MPSGKTIERSDPAALVTEQPGTTDGKLQVGQSTLRFHSTDANQESYLILKITPPAPGATVSLSTDRPEVFQLAVGVDTLAFSPTLTFTPQEKGTYVHLRYLPHQAGSHRAQLTVESEGETQMVWLLGRTRGVRGLVRARQQAAAQPSRLGAKALLGAAVLGLLYMGYQYRDQLLPPPRTAPAQPAITVAPKPVEPSRPVAADPLVKTTRIKKKRPAVVRPVETVKPEPEARQAKVEQVQVQPRPSQPITPVEQAPVARQEVAKAPAKATKKTTAPAAVANNVVQRPVSTPAPAAKPGSESELERILNHSENQ